MIFFPSRPKLEAVIRELGSRKAMKLIQQLERKLSWRKKVSEVGGNLRYRRKAHEGVSVTENEFSRYIHFTKPTSWPKAEISGTYQIVSIKPRATQCVPSKNTAEHRTSSTSGEVDSEVHIYHNIDDLRPTFVRVPKSPSPEISSPRRTRIRTNPWFSQKSFDSCSDCSDQMPNNVYECIEDKENVNHQRPRMATFNKPTDRLGNKTFSKQRSSQYCDPYPLSPLQSEPPIASVAPSQDFLAKSQQICNEINQYVSNNQLDDNMANRSTGSSDLDRSITISSRNSPNHEDINNNWADFDPFESLKRVSPPPPPPPLVSAKRLAEEPGYSRTPKRKRPNPSKRLDEIKFELRQIVIPAILEAAREETRVY